MARFGYTIKSLFITGLLVLFLFSCSSPQEKFIRNFESFVSGVEENADNLSFSDWDALDAEYEGFAEEYKEYSRDFTRDQQKEVGRLFGKYYKLRLRAAGEEIVNYSGLTEGFLEEMGNDFEETFDDIGNDLEDVLDIEEN